MENLNFRKLTEFFIKKNYQNLFILPLSLIIKMPFLMMLIFMAYCTYLNKIFKILAMVVSRSHLWLCRNMFFSFDVSHGFIRHHFRSEPITTEVNPLYFRIFLDGNDDLDKEKNISYIGNFEIDVIIGTL